MKTSATFNLTELMPMFFRPVLTGTMFLAWLLPAGLFCLNATPLAAQTAESGSAPPVQSQGVADSPAVARWKELASQRRQLQKELGTRLNSMSLVVPADQEVQLGEIEQLRIRQNELKTELYAAAVDGLVESPTNNLLMSRDALMYLRVLMGEDEAIALFNPAEAQVLAAKIVSAGVANPQFVHVGIRASVAIHDFETARKLLVRLESQGLGANQAYLEQLQVLEEEWQRELEFRKRDVTAELPIITIETDLGVITAELFEDDAPNTVNNFVSLVERGFYNSQEFFSVQPGFLAHAGCPHNDGSGDSGFAIPEETSAPTARKHFAGSLTTFHLPGKPSSSMYSLVLQPIVQRNDEFTVFGRITGGLDVLYKIPAFSPIDRLANKKAVKILKVTVVRKRNHAYSPSLKTPLDNLPAASGSGDSGNSGNPPSGGGGGAEFPQIEYNPVFQ